MPDRLDQAVQTAIAALYDTVLEPEHAWPHALRSLAGVFDAATSSVFRYEFATRRVRDFLVHGHDPGAMRRYAEHYVHIDPATPVVLSARAGQWLGDERLLDPHDPSHQEYLIDFALPSGIGRVGGGQVAADGRECLYFGVQRPPGAPRFGHEAQRRFQVVAPHLARAVALRAQVARLAAGKALAQSLVDAWSAALCVVDRDGRTHLVNRAASCMLDRDAPLRLSGGRLAGTRSPEADGLSRALRRACMIQGLASCFSVHHGDAAALQVLVLPLPATHDLADGRGEPLALVVVADPATSHLDPKLLQSLFGLTAAESDLLATLVAGGTVGEHAARRGIKVATARTHAAALLSKTGVDSQVRLVALAKSLPAPGH